MKEANIRLHKGSSSNAPKRIIIHAMGEFIDTDNEDYSAHSLLEHYGLSAHVLITPTGVIIRCREDREGAYHAKGNNTDTLGVEFLVKGLHTYETFLVAIKEKYLTTVQYRVGLEFIKEWMKKWGIDKDNVVLHSQVSPGRKFDPGEGFIDSGFLKEL